MIRDLPEYLRLRPHHRVTAVIGEKISESWICSAIELTWLAIWEKLILQAGQYLCTWEQTVSQINGAVHIKS